MPVNRSFEHGSHTVSVSTALRCRYILLKLWVFLMFSDGRRLDAAMLQRRGKAFRPGTQANHRSVAQLYAAFALHFQTPDFPATVSSLLLFAEFLLRTYRAHRSVVNALSSLRTFHLVRGLPTDAFADYQLTLYKRALPLTVRHVPQGAAPLPFQLLEQLCSLAGAQGPAGVAFAALMAATFFSMARLSSLAPPTGGDHYDITRFPTWHDLTQAPNGVTLRIKWAKNRQEAGHSIAAPPATLGSFPCLPGAVVQSARSTARSSQPSGTTFRVPSYYGCLVGATGFLHSTAGPRVAGFVAGTSGTGPTRLFFPLL